MTDRTISIRTALATGPMPAESLRAYLDVSRPTLARALAAMPSEIVTLGAARSTGKPVFETGHFQFRDGEPRRSRKKHFLSF